MGNMFSLGRLLSLALALTVAGVCEAWSATVAVLKSDDLPHYTRAVEGFRAAIPPSTTVVEHLLSSHVAESRRTGQAVRASRPDLVLAIGLRAALTAKLEIPDIPVVFCLVLYPERSGLPAANMAGISMHPSIEYQLSSLRSVLSEAKRVGLLHGETTSQRFLAEAKRKARQFGLEVVPVALPQGGDVPAAVRGLKPIDAIWIVPDPDVVTGETLEFLLAYSFEAGVPLFAFSTTLVQHGAVGASYLDSHDVGVQAARLALRLLDGGDALPLGTLFPAEQPRLAVNERAAEHFQLAIPSTTLQAATARFGAGSLAQGDLPPHFVP